ncbi:GNAT family N-acetyltransferase [Streptacidiphilus melanogenes]|uniref:GNAT family N-acetyltransferase n=1 Tax=Streptacidiphilus melanogenes TaxID=411235 RepID=UPI0005A6DBEA|nr:GNAT family N-acetyltransferase [Streptacidiphilus melanogenes]
MAGAKDTDWRLTEDVEQFRAAADAHLAADPAANTVLLTVSETVRRRGPFAFDADRPARFGWRSGPDGKAVAAFVETPPHGPLLSVMDTESARALAGTLGPVPTVIGEDATVRAYAAATGRGWRVLRAERLFRLGEVTDPGSPPAGVARLAREADLPLLEGWFTDFAAFIGEQQRNFHVADRVADGRLLLWQDETGRPVSMVGWSARVAGQVRVAPVYTPAELRGRGYAGAVVTQASRELQRSGAEQVLLFTDLANPTSNALYQRIGYRPLGDHTVVEFTAP